jgi:hypothetical protein
MGAVSGTMAALIGLSAIGTGAAVYSATRAKKKQAAGQTPAIMPMPTPPKVETAAAQAEASARTKKRAIARSRSIYTSPLGIGGEAQITKKFLLGQ